jgi:HAD superfamily hydrolase (TIGR01509 family)
VDKKGGFSAMKFEAVIFDMDGLLLDTERIALQTFRETCANFGIEVDRKVYLKCIGTNDSKTKEILISGYGETFPYDDFERLWLEKYGIEAYEKPVPLKEGAEPLLESIKRACLPMAVATSTSHEKAVLKLGNAGILDYFKLIVAGDQIKKSKPDPEIYLKTAGRLGVSPERCLALEDSDNGVQSAHAAGMTVIQIPDLVEPSETTKALGHIIVRSLREVEHYLNRPDNRNEKPSNTVRTI